MGKTWPDALTAFQQELLMTYRKRTRDISRSSSTIEVGVKLSDSNATLLIATIGLYQQDRLEFALMQRRIEKIELIHSPADESKNAARAIKKKYGQLVTLHESDPWDYLSLLSLALRIADSNPKYTPEFHIGLGTRVMTMALAMAAFFTNSQMFLVVEDEDRKPRELVEIPILPMNPMSAQKKTILKVLRDLDGQKAESQVALRRHVRDWIEREGTGAKAPNVPSVASVSRHLKYLERVGFVERKKEGKENWVALTELGRTVLSMKETRKRIWNE